MDLRIGLYKTYNDKIVNITEGTDMNKLYKFQGTIDGKDSAAYQWSHQGYDLLQDSYSVRRVTVVSTLQLIFPAVSSRYRILSLN